MTKKPDLEIPSSSSSDSLLKHGNRSGAAPVHLWDPPYCGEMDMRIASDGTWIHEGRPVRRLGMIKLFSSILKLEGDEYYLVSPVEKVKIFVEDCPFLAHSIDVQTHAKNQRLVFTLNTEELVIADAEHRISVDEGEGCNKEPGEPHPKIHVRDGLYALISRNVFYQLVAIAEQRSSDKITTLGVSSESCFFELGHY